MPVHVSDFFVVLMATEDGLRQTKWNADNYCVIILNEHWFALSIIRHSLTINHLSFLCNLIISSNTNDI